MRSEPLQLFLGLSMIGWRRWAGTYGKGGTEMSLNVKHIKKFTQQKKKKKKNTDQLMRSRAGVPTKITIQSLGEVCRVN